MTRTSRKNSPALPVALRKEPKQERSRRMVELVFATTADLLQKEGLDKITTNRIAQECGISIGSLYQYFPNKQSLLLAMAETELRHAAAELREAVVEASKGDVADLEEVIARTLLRSLRPRHRMRRILCDFAIQCGRSDIVHAPLVEAEKMLRESGQVAMPPIKAFVISAAIQGIMRSAAGGTNAWLQSDELPLEMAKLMRCYRAAD
jgi:AcrR family transcriptional regulator